MKKSKILYCLTTDVFTTESAVVSKYLEYKESGKLREGTKIVVIAEMYRPVTNIELVKIK